MKVWTERGSLGDAAGLGIQFSWIDWHIKILELALDLGTRYFSIYIQFKRS